MNNDLIKFNDKQYGIKYSVAQIDFPEYGELKKNVDSLRDEFMKYDVTPDNLSSAKATRAKLNKFARAINSRKIEISREADKPVLDFKAKIKALVDESKEAADHINAQIKAYEAKAKQDRHEQNIRFITKMCEQAGIDTDSITDAENYDARWDNKTFSKAQFQKEVQEKIEEAKKLDEQFKISQKLVAKESDKLGLPAGHWLHLLANGTPVDQVLSQIDQYKQELNDIAEHQREEKKKRAQEDAKLLHKEGKAIDPKTGEVKEKTYTVQLKITATKSQLQQLARYFKDWNIDVERVK